MKNLVKFTPVFILAIIVPLKAYAFTSTTCNTGLLGVICKLSVLLDAILPFLVALGVVYFVWGMVQYFIADGEEAKKTGKDRIIYGIIGLAVIVSIWGLVYILTETLGLGQGGQIAPDVTGLVPGGDGTCSMGKNFAEVLDYATCVIGKSVIPFIFSIAIIAFVWGSLKFFIINSGEEKQRTEGKQFMLWGIIALAVMISIWGLVTILGQTFGLETSIIPTVKP